MARRIPSYVPWNVATDDFLIYKALELFKRGRKLPRGLINEIKRRNLVSRLPQEIIEAYFNGLNGNGNNGKINLVRLYYKLGMIREARELAWRMEFFANFRFVVDGYFCGRPTMILELSIDYVKMMVDGGDIVVVPYHVFEHDFVPASNR